MSDTILCEFHTKEGEAFQVLGRIRCTSLPQEDETIILGVAGSTEWKVYQVTGYTRGLMFNPKYSDSLSFSYEVWIVSVRLKSVIEAPAGTPQLGGEA